MGTLPAEALDPAAAEARSRRLRDAGLTVCFTNGCFDLIHPGHVYSLRSARLLGDALFVGLNSDESVRRLKGPGRPVLDLSSRAAVLGSLRCVDFVVAFDEDTPIELIRLIRPDILVKGADYDESGIVGAELVRSFGGRVVTVPLLEGFSTTSMLDRMGKKT
ncbi:D-glycero-beta-D-manno-heptose 1-phosphate adenylyltransferase [Candidatus Fermentibacterales bacterium]|nr:D-glycero-beta-D-manno-heptose 1-phosphate adenylyltransferase [Candidatus Fermentibacterales bacterium]